MTYVIWEFTVSGDRLTAFETAYKSDGIWAQLFRRDPAYRETVLVRDESAARYLTIDVWEDKESYLRFKERFADEYRKIDEQCESLTASERQIGIFDKV